MAWKKAAKRWCDTETGWEQSVCHFPSSPHRRFPLSHSLYSDFYITLFSLIFQKKRITRYSSQQSVPLLSDCFHPIGIINAMKKSALRFKNVLMEVKHLAHLVNWARSAQKDSFSISYSIRSIKKHTLFPFSSRTS